MFHLRLFVDTDPDVRLSRRGKADTGLSAPGRPGHGSRGSEGPHPAPVATVLRDVHRGRELEQILTQYTTFVKPAFEEFCLPVPPSACLGTSFSPFSEGPPVPRSVRAKPWMDVVCCINGEVSFLYPRSRGAVLSCECVLCSPHHPFPTASSSPAGPSPQASPLAPAPPPSWPVCISPGRCFSPDPHCAFPPPLRTVASTGAGIFVCWLPQWCLAHSRCSETSSLPCVSLGCFWLALEGWPAYRGGIHCLWPSVFLHLTVFTVTR